jgi:hypothetical protein
MRAGITRLTWLAIAVLAPVLARAADPPSTALELLGRGVQIYSCTAGPDGVAWTLKAPEATLHDASGRVAGQHFAGPTWQATDGSKVVGAPMVASVPRGPAAIPWLVLHATENGGTGVFARVTFITRTRTMGGKAPATGCDAAHVGTETRVPYSATYTFFTPVGP